MRPAIFLDRDGVINENRADHVMRWEDFEPVRGALAGLRQLAGLGLPVFVVTNQAIVGRGEVTRDALDALHGRMRGLVAAHGGRIDGVYYCPHSGHDSCDCRKPLPGLFHQAARAHNISLRDSYYVGDALTDIAAGQAAGCQTVMVQTGRGLVQLLRPQARAYSGYEVARDLAHAAKLIKAEESRRAGRARPFAGLRVSMRHAQFV